MEDTKPKPFVFALMPFQESFNDVYQVGIKQACKDAGAYCERVDEQIFVENILERVYNQIAKADIIVAEMTGRNPNVFYEVGYAHALNKQVILLTKNSDDIPFDLKHYPHIVYSGSIATLKSQLEVRVRWCIENPKQSLSKVDLALEFFVNGVPLIDRPIIGVKLVRWKTIRSEISIKIALHNPTSKTISDQSFYLALITPSIIIGGDGIRSVTEQPNERSICNLTRIPSIFPDGWEGLYVSLNLHREDIPSKPMEMTLRLFTEVGAKDYPFLLSIEHVEDVS